MKYVAIAIALPLLLALPATVRADGGSPTHQASVSARWEQPDRGLDTWRALRVEVASTPGNWRRAWQLAAVSEHRFDAHDHGVELGASLPLDDHWLLQAEAGVAPDAHFLARHSAELRAVRRFGHGVLATVGVRSARYRDVRADRVLLSLERYAGAWRIAGTASLVRVDGARAPGQELALDRYAGDRDSIGLRLSRGKELVPLADGSRRFARVQSAALVGRRWISPRWGVQGVLGYADQSGLYDRAWLQLGVMHAW